MSALRLSGECTRDECKYIVNNVILEYGALASWKLSELSHKEISWKNARTGLREGENGNRKLKLEDSFKNGPLLSPDIFEDLCAKHYRKRNNLCCQYGLDIISLDCAGVSEKLLPTWFENGVNTMFPIEVGVWGDQFEAARGRFGKGMLGVGGMDKTAFRKDKAAVDAEIERMKRLASLGGFLPCPDHRIMPGSSFELVQYYAEEIKRIKV